MAAVFGCMVAIALFNPLIARNRPYYFAGFVYSAVAICLFHVLRKDSLAAQLVIYLSMSVLFLIGGFISQNNPNYNATTFMVFLLVMPMFMIDKPFFMTIAIYHGHEKIYSEIFKKADTALYKAKVDPECRYCVYE